MDRKDCHGLSAKGSMPQQVHSNLDNVPTACTYVIARRYSLKLNRGSGLSLAPADGYLEVACEVQESYSILRSFPNRVG